VCAFVKLLEVEGLLLAATVDHTFPPAGGDEVEVAEGITWRAILWSLIFLVVSSIWIQWAGLISHGTQIGESVPVIPAIGAAIFLTLIAPLLRRISRRLELSQRQVMLVYMFLCVAVTMPSVGVVRMLFPNTTAVFYFASPENDFARFQQYMPTWMAPHDPEVIRQMYEGSPEEKVPWKAWMVPLAAWTFFFAAVFITMLCVITLFRRQWAEKERLTFPIVHMMLDVSDQTGRRLGRRLFPQSVDVDGLRARRHL